MGNNKEKFADATTTGHLVDGKTKAKDSLLVGRKTKLNLILRNRDGGTVIC